MKAECDHLFKRTKGLDPQKQREEHDKFLNTIPPRLRKFRAEIANRIYIAECDTHVDNIRCDTEDRNLEHRKKGHRELMNRIGRDFRALRWEVAKRICRAECDHLLKRTEKLDPMVRWEEHGEFLDRIPPKLRELRLETAKRIYEVECDRLLKGTEELDSTEFLAHIRPEFRDMVTRMIEAKSKTRSLPGN